jgi:hypothetical protein
MYLLAQQSANLLSRISVASRLHSRVGSRGSSVALDVLPMDWLYIYKYMPVSALLSNERAETNSQAVIVDVNAKVMKVHFLFHSHSVN